MKLVELRSLVLAVQFYRQGAFFQYRDAGRIDFIVAQVDAGELRQFGFGGE